MTEGFSHVPVMLDAVMNLLCPERGGIFVDGTLGGGGHSEAILQRLPDGSKLYGIDRDKSAIEAAGKRLAPFSDKFFAIRGNFFDMRQLLDGEGVRGVNGILLDLGVSSHQLDTVQRGFSYHHDAPLDMRMDTDSAFSAADVVNGYSLGELVRIIRDYGEERYASRIAHAIVRERGKLSITSTTALAQIIKSAVPAAARWEGTHPARRTFQAIRIEVNGELSGLEQAINDAKALLNSNGIFCIITFHSLEDRIVKQAFRRFENPCVCDPRAPLCTCGKTPTAKVITRKPIVADDEEIARNARSKSAKLRAMRKL